MLPVAKPEGAGIFRRSGGTCGSRPIKSPLLAWPLPGRIRNEGAGDLEVRKIYQIPPDTRAAKDKHFKVIDESGEDYLYPADYFVHLTLPREVERAL